ncbi:hypothetical protein B4599_06465 [Xanthomonas oryzae pv. oryzae]|nr:hypothetical protein B4599_06465 [Xanthomonas oryzae pv. oryzae]RBI40020.1 hypothetical protein BRL99_21495 [Xanthomonas oryzae pv. oryzae]RBI42291.1 hypothetical protein BRL69_05105 [Xanthomonas oryzae pv. oryzae]
MAVIPIPASVVNQPKSYPLKFSESHHFSHPDISQAGYASLNPWRGRKGAGLRVRHRIRGRASCMTGGASRRVAVTRATNCRRCDAVSHRERAQPSLS